MIITVKVVNHRNKSWKDMWGRRSKIDGYISKCNSECKNCDKCYGKKYGSKSNNSSNDNKYTTVKPLTSLKELLLIILLIMTSMN